MKINDPEIKELINKWQTELREKTNDEVSLIAVQLEKSRMSFDELKRIVCELTGITPQRLVHKTQTRDVVFARFIVAYFAREYLKLSYPKITEKLERKDHTIALKGVRKIKDFIHIGDKEVCGIVAKINSEIEKFNSNNHAT